MIRYQPAVQEALLVCTEHYTATPSGSTFDRQAPRSVQQQPLTYALQPADIAPGNDGPRIIPASDWPVPPSALLGGGTLTYSLRTCGGELGGAVYMTETGHPYPVEEFLMAVRAEILAEHRDSPS